MPVRSYPDGSFLLTGSGLVFCDLEEDQGILVRSGFSPDLSLMKEWPLTYRAVEPHMRGHKILDIGANIGMFSRLALTKYGASSAVCYEPEPGAFSVLRRNVPFGVLRRRAVCARAGAAVLSLPKSGNSIAASTERAFRGRQEIKVGADSFTEVVSEHRPSLLKSDCEGAELSWLDGRTLNRCVKVVTAELHREGPGWEGRCQEVISSFAAWTPIHAPKSYSFHRCWIVSWIR